MAVPFWFDANAYLVNKGAQMGMDTLGARQAFVSANWPVTDQGLYDHFVAFGNAEGVSPNSWFDNSQYLHNKAADFYGTSNVTENQAKSMLLAMNQAGMSPWSHFQAFWAENFATTGNFNNPSVGFDVNAYMNDKLTLMQKTNPTYTMAMLVKDFQTFGLDPVSHYMVAGAQEGLAPKPVASGTPGSTYRLTSSDDSLFGTTGDDYFNAPVGTLGDNDYIDGGAGNDTLKAVLKAAANDVVAPTITNVETILFQAQANTTGGAGENNPQGYIDAGDISLGKGQMLTLGSVNSRAALSIEDVRHNSNETTIRLADADAGSVNGGADFSVYFDSQHLKSADTTQSGELVLEIIDGENAVNSKPLLENPYDSVKFTYNGQVVEVKFGAVNGDSTYQNMVDAINAAIGKDPALAGLTAELGPEFSFTNKDGVTVKGNQILISTDDGTVSAEGGRWLASGGVSADSNISTSMGATNSSDCPLIQTNVELDNVGRVQWNEATPGCLPDDIQFGGEGVDLVIGGMGVRDGVQRFDMTVDRGSWLSSVSSTNNTLRMVTVTGEDINADGIIGNVSSQANNAAAQAGQLYIGSALDAGAANQTSWKNADTLLKTDGLKDVKYFRAANEKGDLYSGDINLGASITAEALPKYMADVDGLKTVYDKYAPSGAFEYVTGTGNDVLNMSVHGGIAADRDFQLNITTNAGNDLVNFGFDFKSVNQAIDQSKLANVNISTGEGNDTVWTWGENTLTMNNTLLDQALRPYNGVAGSVNIDAGNGSDTVYAAQDNTLVPNSVWVLNGNVTGNENPFGVSISPSGEGQPLNNNVASTANEYTVTGKVAGTSYALNVTVSFLGVNVTAAVGTYTASGTEYKVSIADINKAIIAAINGDKVLGQLLAAKDGAGYGLLVQSLIDGKYDMSDFDISFSDMTGTTVDDVTTDFGDFVNQGATADSVQTWTLAGLTISNTTVYTLHIDGKIVTFTSDAAATIANMATALKTVLDAAFDPAEFTVTGTGTTLTITGTDEWINDLTVDTTTGFTGADVSYDYSEKIEGTDSHYYGQNVISGGAGDDVLVTGYADAIVRAGDGNDTIIAGNAAFVQVAGGKGVDHIYLGDANFATNADAFDSVIQAVGDSTYVKGSTTNYNTSNVDVVFNFNLAATGTSVSDKLVLASWMTGQTLAMASADNITSWATFDAMTDNQVGYAKGVYDAESGTFTLNAAGTDVFVVYDADTGAGMSFESVILVGTGANATAGITITNGDITFNA